MQDTILQGPMVHKYPYRLFPDCPIENAREIAKRFIDDLVRRVHISNFTVGADDVKNWSNPGLAHGFLHGIDHRPRQPAHLEHDIPVIVIAREIVQGVLDIAPCMLVAKRKLISFSTMSFHCRI